MVLFGGRDNTKGGALDKQMVTQSMAARAQELHRRSLKPRKTRPVLVFGRDETWTSDAMDMQSFDKSKEFLNDNDGFRHIVVILDVFSGYAWAVPTKTVSTKDVWGAIEGVMQESGRRPLSLWCDMGSGYISKDGKAIAKRLGITVYHT